MTHQLNIFLLLFGALQGALVSFFLLMHKKRDPSQIFLTLFLLVVGLQLTFKVITKTWLMTNVLVFYNLCYCLPYLVGPLIYWFIRARYKKIVFKPFDVLHLFPFALCIVLTIRCMAFGSVYSDALTVWMLHPYVAAFLQLILLLTYAAVSWKITHTSTENSKPGLKQFILFVVTAETIIIVAIALMHVYYGRFPDIRLLFLVLTFLIYWISYKLVVQSDLFMSGEPSSPVIPLKIDNNLSKYAHSGLKSEEANRIATLLHEAMHQRKLFLESDISIDTLASSLNVSRHHLSQVINERFQKSYFDFMNGLRVEEARNRLANKKYAHYTIAAIALDSGFSSVSSFNEAFKRLYGITPSKFREESRKKMSA